MAEQETLKESITEDVFYDSEIEALPEAVDVVFSKIGKGKYFEGIGRRKRATARVRIWDETNKNPVEINMTVNDKDYKDYFKNIEFQKIVVAPLKKLKAFKVYRVTCKTSGGGLRGQAEAIRLGLARALILLNNNWRLKLKKAGFLTRDSREVERKKYGKRKARKKEQWQKR